MIDKLRLLWRPPKLKIFRTMWYSLLFRKKVIVTGPIQIHGHHKNIIIRDSVTINSYTILCTDEKSKIILNNNVRISFSCVLVTVGLDVNNLGMKRTHIPYGDIILEENVWLGSGSIVLGNVKIGKNSVVAAGSVVTEDIPPNCVVAGIPAKIVKRLE